MSIVGSSGFVLFLLWTLSVTGLVVVYAARGAAARADRVERVVRIVESGSAPTGATGGGTVTEFPRQAARMRRLTAAGAALPPTLVQRIRAEAHGSSPSARRRSTTALAAAGRPAVTDRDQEPFSG
ncbi:DUF6344 domain-containing protein [Streptomyces sp. BI20]|uniref:DUF6344 domain-containing protein n=1 Tax=Streptomyces sp. BI20 TaxID=3403460 RepID=UPI003C753070